MTLKKIVTVLLCLLLVLVPVFPATAAEEGGEEADTDKMGKISGKDEVVYGSLSANGEGIEFYVVNRLEVGEEGRIVDYGNYSTLKNLTDLSEIIQSGDRIEMTAEEGKFFYQGNMEDVELPWAFSITYLLDGKMMNPENLAGQNGNLEIRIETAANEKAAPTFFENYMLQISLVFDGEKTKNIETEDGMLANAGKDEQVTFTVLPEEEAELAVTADVEDFELAGIDIVAVPQNMPLDAPDTDEFSDDITTLSDALQQLDEGVLELEKGARELHDGTAQLQDGSGDYKNGIDALSSGSGALVEGSRAIGDALETISESLGNTEMEDVDLSELAEVTKGLYELSEALGEMEDGLERLNDGFGEAYFALDEAMAGIPNHEVTEEDFYALIMSGADRETVNKLAEVYESAMIAKGTYDYINGEGAFVAVSETLEQATDGLSEMAESVDMLSRGFQGFTGNLDFTDLTSGIRDLQEGIEALAANYKDFHSGLVKYTDGVGELASGYAELDRGLSELNDGTKQLADGVSELQDGTGELVEATKDMPDQVTKEIDELLAQYDKSDFEPVSFVSEKNEKVNSVQFVLKTEPIEKEENDEEQVEKEEKKSFWQRFLDLFR